MDWGLFRAFGFPNALSCSELARPELACGELASPECNRRSRTVEGVEPNRGYRFSSQELTYFATGHVYFVTGYADFTSELTDSASGHADFATESVDFATELTDFATE